MELVHLDPVTRLSPAVIRVLGLNPGQYTLQGSNIYVIGQGPRRILLDTGEGKPGFIPLLLSALQQGQTQGDPTASSSSPTTKVEITDVIISHWHRDHTGGIASVHEAFPNAKFWQFPSDTNNNFPEAPSLHNTSSNTISACNCSASAGTKDSVATASELESAGFSGPTILPLQDGQLFPVPGVCVGEGDTSDVAPPLSLRIVHCPGHTADHVAVVLEPALPGEAHPVLFTGDCVLGQGSAVFESLSEYLVSLRKLLNSFPGDDCVIYPAHGPVVQNGSAKIKEYIEHRMLREKQIIGVLDQHAQQTQEDDAPVGLSAMEVVGIVYKQQNLSELLTKAACHSVLLHLNKLLQDGMVAVDDTAGATSPSERHHQRWRLVHTQPTPKSGML